MMVMRWTLSMAMACGITLSLFYFMQALIATGGDLEQNLSIVKIVDATMPDIAMEVVEEIDKPEPIEDNTEVPEEAPERQINLSEGPAINIDRGGIEIDTGLELSNASISATDGDYLPLVAIAPNILPVRLKEEFKDGVL